MPAQHWLHTWQLAATRSATKAPASDTIPAANGVQFVSARRPDGRAIFARRPPCKKPKKTVAREHRVKPAVEAFDEGRFGLKTRYRKRWCPCGVRSPWFVHRGCGSPSRWNRAVGAVMCACGPASMALGLRLPCRPTPVGLFIRARDGGESHVRTKTLWHIA